MSVSDRIIREFTRHGVRHYFGLPGSGFLLDLIDSGRRNGIEFHPTANESSAAIAAAYYGRLTGTAGLAFAIQGPGAANLASGAAFARFERMPVVCLCECPRSGDDALLVQRCDQQALFEASVNQHFLVTSVADTATIIANACGAATGRQTEQPSGRPLKHRPGRPTSFRPGPVFLEVPKDASTWIDDITTGPESVDVLDQPAKISAAATNSVLVEQTREKLPAVVEFLITREKPVLIAGGDALRGAATDSLIRFARAYGAPVLVATDGRGVFPEGDPLFAGVFANLNPDGVLANRLLRDCDGVFAIGVDPLACEAPWNRNIPVCELSIGGEGSSFFASKSTDSSISSDHLWLSGDLARLLNELETAMRARRATMAVERPERAHVSAERAKQARNDVAASFARPEGARFAVQDIIEISRRLLPPEGILFSETGVFVLMLEYLWRVDLPDTFFGTAGGRSMGLMIPALLGGKIARPNTPMMGIGGDGSTLMRLGELSMIGAAGIAAPMVIVNDSALGTIKSRQKSRGLPEYGLDLSITDFSLVARAAGLEGVRVDTPDEFEDALKMAFKSDRATVIDARVDGEAYRNSFGATTTGDTHG